jgi:hypothetical protein
MARIRTIKPEFWSSPGLPNDPWVRLLFIAMWNWADDYGIGSANERELLGFAFPNDDGITITDLRRMLASVRRVFGVEFYTVGGRPYYAIPSWDSHQKIDRRSARRNPGPGAAETRLYQEPPKSPRDSAESPPSSQRVSGVGKGTEDLGTEDLGTEPPYPPELEPPPSQPPARRTGAEIARSDFADIPSAPSPLARQVATAYSRSLTVPLESKVLGDVASQIDRCLRSQIPPDAIAAGIEDWPRSDSWSPSQIPKFVHKANRHRNGNHVVGKPTQKALDYDTAAEQLIAALEANP